MSGVSSSFTWTLSTVFQDQVRSGMGFPAESRTTTVDWITVYGPETFQS